MQRSKKEKRSKRKRQREAQTTKYLENTAKNEGHVNANKRENLYAIEESNLMAKLNPHAVSVESLLSLTSSGGRSRTASRLSTINSKDFWQRHFDGDKLISWKRFRAAFLEDYGSMIHEFAPKRIHWILYIVHTDIFAAQDDIHKLYYDKFCGKSKTPDRLWEKIKEYASERIFREGVIESMLE